MKHERVHIMKHFYLSILLSLSLFFLLPSCSRKDESEHAHGGEEGGEAPTNRVEIPSTVRNNLGITFAKVERRSVATTIRVPGSFELQPRAKMEYRPLLAGQVEFVVDELDKVEPGTVLYRFRSPEWLELQSRIDLALASLEQAEVRSRTVEKRLAALKEANFKRADLEMESDELRAEVVRRGAELETALDRAARVLNLHSTTESTGMTPDKLLSEVEQDGRIMPYYQTVDTFEVKAAQSGYVESVGVTNGAYVEEATLLLTTIDPEKVRFRAFGMQGDLPTFTKSSQARIVPPQAGGADINDSIGATLQVGLAADPNARTVTLYAQPEEIRPWIRPGVSAFLEVAADSTGGIVLAIPRSAVVKDGITHVFFKRDPADANKAIRVEADLGVDDGRWIEVKSEVGPNDEVVLDGAYELKLATAQSGTAQKGGHFHADGTYHAEED